MSLMNYYNNRLSVILIIVMTYSLQKCRLSTCDAALMTISEVLWLHYMREKRNVRIDLYAKNRNGKEDGKTTNSRCNYYVEMDKIVRKTKVVRNLRNKTK